MKEQLEKCLELFEKVANNQKDTVAKLELLTLITKTVTELENTEKITVEDLAAFDTDKKRAGLVSGWLAGICIILEVMK